MSEEIYVSFDKDIYRKDYSQFIVSLYHLLDSEGEHEKSVICTGNNIPDTKDASYKFTGQWVTHPKYGHQFKVESFEPSFRVNKKEIVNFFASPIIKGVGRVLAGRIYDEFGEDTFKVLDKTPERLLKVRGITEKKYEQVMESYKASRNVTKIFDFLKTFMSPSNSLAQKIYEKFGDKALSTIKTHPYRLCWIKDISYKTADQIGKQMGCDMASYERIACAANYILINNEVNGHTCMEIQAFGKELERILYVRDEEFCLNKEVFHKFINDKVIELIKNTDIYYKKIHNTGYISRKSAYEAEKDSAEAIFLMTEQNKLTSENIDRLISKYEKQLGITLDKCQRDAVVMGITEPVSVVTGGPGTGKTTIMQIISLVFKEITDGTVLFTAPTGRAARRLSESVKETASTIHSVLKIRDSEDYDNAYENEDDEEGPIDTADMVIVDEASFIDIWLMDRLLKKMHKGQKLLLVGDEDQLQSVSAGAVLRDMLSSDVVPYVTLEKIFRQGKDSEIVINSSKIKNGETDLTTGETFEIRDNLYGEILEQEMLSIYFDEVKKYGVEQVACLCPVKDYAAGVNSMNLKIQERLNPYNICKDEIKVGFYTYRVGDLVMELKNKAETSNGDIGFITDIDVLNKTITCKINDKEISYKGDEIIERLTLAYAMTVHKSQGSEYDSVITCLQDTNKYMCKRSIPYTSFSRGKKKVFFLGSKRALNEAIMYNDKEYRQTMLKYLLKNEIASRQFVAV